MIETIAYAILTLFGIALGTGVAAVVAGFVAFWIWLAAAFGWELAKSMLHR